MIQLSECFSRIGSNEGCCDVASSLAQQGFGPEMQEISIPIYGPFFLKIYFGQNCGFICSSLEEVNALRQLNVACGTVTAGINLIEMDMLTLVGLCLTFTPNTGMNVFAKLSAVDLVNTGVDTIIEIAKAVGFPIPNGLLDGFGDIVEYADELLEFLFNLINEILSKDLESKGINLMSWEELPGFVAEVKESGEMQQMYQFRQQIGAAVF